MFAQMLEDERDGGLGTPRRTIFEAANFATNTVDNTPDDLVQIVGQVRSYLF